MAKKYKLYTKTGDTGETRLVGGAKTIKSDPRVAVYGNLDELNAHLGLIRTLSKEAELINKICLIQNELFDLGSDLANPNITETTTIKDQQIERLEKWIDEQQDLAPEIKNFILPGGTEISAYLHIARTVCRRAERELVAFIGNKGIYKNALIYLNRLSDLLFAMARAEVYREKAEEFIWKK